MGAFNVDETRDTNHISSIQIHNMWVLIGNEKILFHPKKKLKYHDIEYY